MNGLAMRVCPTRERDGAVGTRSGCVFCPHALVVTLLTSILIPRHTKREAVLPDSARGQREVREKGEREREMEYEGNKDACSHK